MRLLLEQLVGDESELAQSVRERDEMDADTSHFVAACLMVVAAMRDIEVKLEQIRTRL